jgi:hypothetical protein
MKFVPELFLFEDWTEETPLINLAKVPNGPSRPSDVVERVALYGDIPIRSVRESSGFFVTVSLAMDRKEFVLQLMLIKLINQSRTLTPEEYREYYDCFVIGK